MYKHVELIVNSIEQEKYGFIYLVQTVNRNADIN